MVIINQLKLIKMTQQERNEIKKAKCNCENEDRFKNKRPSPQRNTKIARHKRKMLQGKEDKGW